MKFTIIIVIFFLSFSFNVDAQIKVGDSIPSIKLKSSLNNDINLNQFKDKYLLIDFWTSWCGPCRLGNKKLVNLHSILNSDKIAIVGVSLDKVQEKWLKAIKKDKIKFTQLIDPNGFDARTALLFGVEELPSKYLFNDKGILIKKNPTEEEIINLIK